MVLVGYGISLGDILCVDDSWKTVFRAVGLLCSWLYAMFSVCARFSRFTSKVMLLLRDNTAKTRAGFLMASITKHFVEV